MSKELEAFNNLVERLAGGEYDINLLKTFDKEYLFIETALKRANILDFIAVDIEQDNKALCKENKKLKRALDIIKKTGCSYEHILLIERTKNYKVYETQFDNYLENRYESFKFELKKSKEEYDLLKEALKNE